MHELRSYPVAEHDDTVMALWFCDHAADVRRGPIAAVHVVEQAPQPAVPPVGGQQVGSQRRTAEEPPAVDQLGRPIDARRLRRRQGIPLPPGARGLRPVGGAGE